MIVALAVFVLTVTVLYAAAAQVAPGAACGPLVVPFVLAVVLPIVVARVVGRDRHHRTR